MRPKDPLEYLQKLRFHRGVDEPGAYGHRCHEQPAGGDRVEIFTDGACSGNPGPGGWGAILRYGEVEKELSGGDPPTTNNRMEMMAAIAGLEALKRPCRVALYTDSQYLRDGITQWLPRLEGARLAHRRQEAGQERRSVAAPRDGAAPHQVEWHWVQRPCRPPRERARRRAGPRRHHRGARRAVVGKSALGGAHPGPLPRGRGGEPAERDGGGCAIIVAFITASALDTSNAPGFSTLSAFTTPLSHHHRIALGAHAEAEAAGVELEPHCLGELAIAVGEHHHLAVGPWSLPQAPMTKASLTERQAMVSTPLP